MKHRVSVNPLGRKPAHRKALHRNMVTSLFAHERIRTTKAKAQAVRRTAEKMISRARVDSVHNRRIIFKDIKDDAVLAKLFTEIGPRFKDRPGGYTRILKLGQRRGDAGEMVLLELVEREGGQSEKPKRQRRAQKQEAKQQEEASRTPVDESASEETVE
ncbi:MAG: 50S ribosomal protein L17 [Spirochaetaceae bacterium]